MRLLLLSLLILNCAFPLLRGARGQSLQSEARPSRRLSQQNATVIEVSTETELQDAFANLESGDTIQLDEGLYSLSRGLALTVSNVTVVGREGTFLRCPSDASGLTIRASGVTVSLLTFERCGNSSAVTIEGSNNEDAVNTSVVLNSVAFQNNNNRSQELSPQFSALLVRRCRSPPCTGSRPFVEVWNSTFKDNESRPGGCAYCDDSMLRINNSVFTNNVASSDGGAIHATGYTAVLEVVDSQFTGNTVSRRGGENFQFLNVYGRGTERPPYFPFVFSEGNGGAIYVNDITNLTVVNSVFRFNRAIAGGAISIESSENYEGSESALSREVLISGCLFESNQANQTGTASAIDVERNHGGAIYIITSFFSAESLNLENCTFRNNSAHYGGAVHFMAIRRSLIRVVRCFFEDNWAAQAGGAMVFRNTQVLRMINTTCIRNSAEHGGAVWATNNANLHVGLENSYGVLFLENTALYGGGIMCVGCDSIQLSSANFTRNSAQRTGGGLYAVDTPSDIHVLQSVFHSNVATLGGGAAFVAVATVTFSSSSEQFENVFINNTATAGGGIFVEATRRQENRIHIANCRFEANMAVSYSPASFLFAAEALRDEASNSRAPLLQQRNNADWEEEMEQSRFSACGDGGGGGMCLVFNSVPVDSPGDLRVENVTLERNQAVVGGGVFLNIAGARWNPQEESSCSNTSSPTTNPCRHSRLLNITYSNNVAEFSGGIFVTEPKSVVIGCPTMIQDNWIDFLSAWENEMLGEATCTFFEENSVIDAEGRDGADVGSVLHSLELADPISSSITNHTGEGVQIAVRDRLNQTIVGGLTASRLSIVLVSSSILGARNYVARNGMVNVNETRGIGIGQRSSIEFQVTDNRNLSVRLVFSTRRCYPGEYESSNSTGCEPCGQDQYAFHASNSCRTCESRARCTGGAALIPDTGYWHSTPFSPQFHECIIKQACDYEERTERLSSYSADRSKMDRELRALDADGDREEQMPVFDSYQQCAVGYTGALCGSCMPGYGRISGGECIECPKSITASRFLVFLIVLWVFVLISTNILLTFSSTRKQICKALMAENDHVEMVEIEHRGENRNAPAQDMLSDTDHRADVEKLSEILKILINYLQVTGAALHINETWNTVIEVLLSVEAALASASSPSSYTPLECSFTTNDDEDPRVPNSVKAFRWRIVLPLLYWIIFIGSIQLHFARSKKSRSGSRHGMRNDGAAAREPRWTYSIVATLVLAYFSYIDLTSEFMRAVNCIEVDHEASDPPHEYDRYAIERGGRVWAEDSSLHCFEGNHTSTGVIGVLGLVLFSGMFIVFVPVWFFWRRDSLEDPHFIARYGVLYRNYKKQHWYTVSWEAVISVRKALIAAVVVFAFPLGSNLQAACAMGVLILALTVHWVVKPFEEHRDEQATGGASRLIVPQLNENSSRLDEVAGQHQRIRKYVSLNNLEAASLLMSYIIFYSGVLFNDDNTAEVAKYIVALFALLTNLSFIGYVIFCLYAGGHMVLDAHLESHSLDDGTLPGNILYPKGSSFWAFLRKIVACLKHGWYHLKESIQPSGDTNGTE